MEHQLMQIKNIGLIVAAVSVVSFFILLNVSYQIAETGHAQCPGLVTGCTILGHFPTESFFGLSALAALAAGGIFIFIRARQTQLSTINASTALTNAIKKLAGDEKKIYELVAPEGTAFQSDLVKGTGFSKVKMSRILDRLEAKGLLERRRRGMANLIVAKR